MLEVAHIGDVADVAYLVAQMGEVAEEYVEGDGRTGVSEMSVAVDRGSAYIHSHTPFVDRAEKLFVARKGVVDGEIVGFHRKVG